MSESKHDIATREEVLALPTDQAARARLRPRRRWRASCAPGKRKRKTRSTRSSTA